jgi:hypothetical protein
VNIAPESPKPLNELKHLLEATQLKNTGNLYHYNITNKGLEEKGTIGKIWADFLSILSSLIGWDANSSAYSDAAQKYLPLVPQNLEDYRARFSATNWGNLENINRISEVAKNLVTHVKTATTDKKLLANASQFETLTQQLESKLIKDQLEALTSQVTLPEKIAAIKDPCEKYLELLPDGLKNTDTLKEQFQKDITRQQFFIEERSVDGSLSQINDHTYKLFNDESELSDQEHAEEDKKFIIETIKKIESIVREAYPEKEIQSICEKIQCFLNQTVGNILLGKNKNYSEDDQKKTVSDAIYGHVNRNPEDKANPLSASIDPYIRLSSDATEMTYGGKWQIHEGGSNKPSIATVKSEATVNFKTGTLTITTMKDFKVSNECTFAQIKRLEERFLPKK